MKMKQLWRESYKDEIAPEKENELEFRGLLRKNNMKQKDMRGRRRGLKEMNTSRKGIQGADRKEKKQ